MIDDKKSIEVFLADVDGDLLQFFDYLRNWRYKMFQTCSVKLWSLIVKTLNFDWPAEHVFSRCNRKTVERLATALSGRSPNLSPRVWIFNGLTQYRGSEHIETKRLNGKSFEFLLFLKCDWVIVATMDKESILLPADGESRVSNGEWNIFGGILFGWLNRWRLEVSDLSIFYNG